MKKTSNYWLAGITMAVGAAMLLGEGYVPPGASIAQAEDSAAAQSIDAAELWKANCAGCHGVDGQGKTRVGKRKGVKDMTDAAYQATFSDEQGFKSTKEGMEKDGKEVMPGYGEGFKEKNPLSDAEITALVAHVRTFAK